MNPFICLIQPVQHRVYSTPLKDVLDMTLAQLNLTPQKLRDLLALVTEHRKKAAVSE